jgi:hypothetical protein
MQIIRTSSSSRARITGTAPTATDFVPHIGIPHADESCSPVTWREHVSDEQYGQAPDLTEVSR